MDGKWLTASVLFCLHRRGMSHTCINIPFRLAITTAAKTDCQERQGRLSYSGEWFSMWWLLNPLLLLRWQSSEGEVCYRCGEKQCYTFCKGSNNFPRATMAIITIPAEIMPATWKTYVSHNQGPSCPLWTCACWTHACKSLFMGTCDTSQLPTFCSILLRQVRIICKNHTFSSYGREIKENVDPESARVKPGLHLDTLQTYTFGVNSRGQTSSCLPFEETGPIPLPGQQILVMFLGNKFS